MDSKEQTLQILSNATGTNTELLNIKVSPGVGDIVVQLDVFNEQNENPKALRQSSTESINLNSHQEVFQTILQQVAKTSSERTFLIILQHLLRIDQNDTICDVMWQAIEKLVHRATQLESNEEAERLVNSSITHKFSCHNCRAKIQDKEETIENKTEMRKASPPLSSPPPLPSELKTSPNAVPVPPIAPQPPAPPIPPQPPQPPAAPGLPPPPPPPSLGGMGPPVPSNNPLAKTNNILLPQQNAPKASKKLKTFNWTKIPQHKIMNKLNIWTIMANDRQYKCVELIDFKGIEGLFAVQTANKPNKVKDEVDGMAAPPIKKEIKNIHLLDAQRSLKVNIFLSQFKGYNSEDIVQLIRIGDCKIMNLERLKDLKKFFENEEEIILLKNYVGDRQRLASAEKFLISMLEVSNFKLRIESMTLKEEFQINATYLEPCLNDIIQAGNNLMKNKTLQEILGVIIIIGNFLNSGGYAGNAAGIKLSSLTKLTEIKANKTGMHLLHLIALEVKRYNPELLDLSNELSFLENVSKINNDQIEKDIKDMELALDSNKKQISSTTTDEDIKQQMKEFIEKAENKMEILKERISELKSLRIEMADFFCEDLTTFKIDECFEIFHKFCEQFKQALKENDKRQQLEMQESLRQKQKEEQLAQKALMGSTIQSKSPLHLPPKRLCLRSSREFIKADNKKAEDDLMEFLENSNRKRNREKETNRKARLDKRPDILKFSFERERDQHSPNFAENCNENTSPSSLSVARTPLMEDTRKTNLIQKSWKRLMEGYKTSQVRDNCLTPDIAPKAESLQIFISSNSTIDNISGQNKKQPSIKIIKTPLLKSFNVFNFSLQEIQAIQAETKNQQTENFDEKILENSEAIRPSCIDLSKDREINHETSTTVLPDEPTVDIRPPRLKLRTMASIVQLGCRYSSINEEDLKTTIKKLRTPTLEKSQFCFSPTSLKSNNWNYDQNQSVLNSVDEENSNQELNENLENKNMELQQPKNESRNVVEQKRADEKLLKITEPVSSEITAKTINSNEGLSVIEDEKINDQVNNMQNFSKRLVTKLQDTIRALSPLRAQQTTIEKQTLTLHNEERKEPLSEPGNSNSNQTINNDAKDKPLIIVTAPSMANVKKSFVDRLQSRIRALSPLKLQHEKLANFQSYVDFENSPNASAIVKSKEINQFETNIRKQAVVKPNQRTIITKESIPKEQLSNKDITKQLRLSRPDSRISVCSTKTINSSNNITDPEQTTQSTKTSQKFLHQGKRSFNTAKTRLTTSSSNSFKTIQTTKLDNSKRKHCQDWQSSTNSKIVNSNLKSLPSAQTKSLSSSTRLQKQKLGQQRNTSNSVKQLENQKRLSLINNNSSKNVPKSRSSLLPNSLPSRTSEKPAIKFTYSKPTKHTKPSDCKTNARQNLTNSPEAKTTKSVVKKDSSMQSHFLTNPAQSNAKRYSNIGAFSGPNLAEKNGMKPTFSEICKPKGANKSSSANIYAKNLPSVSSRTPTNKITNTPTTAEQAFKRPCKKFK